MMTLVSGTLLLAALHSSLGNLVTWNTPSTRPPVPVEVMLEDTLALEDIEVAINRVGTSSKVGVRCGAIPGCRRDCGVPVYQCIMQMYGRCSLVARIRHAWGPLTTDPPSHRRLCNLLPR